MARFKRQRSPILWITLASTLAVIAVGFWILITPSNPLVRVFRSAVSSPEARVISGPYPMEEDLDALKRHGVAVVVSLLDPQLPYEGVLVGREEEAVKARGMAFHNFPMASVFGRRLGSQYDRNADAAAEAIANAEGKVYVHCYLGLHRVRVVEQRLAALTHAAVQHYLLREGERGQTQRWLDQAQAAFDAGRYDQALALLGHLKDPDVPALVLGAWAAYRKGDVAAARGRFETVLGQVPGSQEGLRGLGYCAVREQRWKDAEGSFLSILKDEPDEPGALYGLATAHRGEGRPAEAASVLHTLLAAHPDHQEGRALLLELEGRTPR